MAFVKEETIVSMHMINLQNHLMSVDTTWLGTAHMVLDAGKCRHIGRNKHNFLSKSYILFSFLLSTNNFYEKSHKRHQMIDQTGEILCIQNRIQVK